MTDGSVWKIIDWLVRVCAPKWLDAAGLTIDAAALRALPALTAPADAQKAALSVSAARDSARTLWVLVQRKVPGGDAAGDALRLVLEEAMRDVGWAASGAKDTWAPDGLMLVADAMHAAWYAAGAASVVSAKETDPDATVKADADAALRLARDDLKLAAATLQAALDKSVATPT